MAARRPPWHVPVCVLSGGIAALVVALLDGLLWGAIVGALVLAIVIAVVFSATRAEARPDPGRRRFLTLVGLGGLAALLGGDALGWAVRRATRPDPAHAIREMAENLGADGLGLMLRTYHPGRSGDLQLVLTPGSTANYANESRSLLRRDPRSSHALPWLYLERVPIVVWTGERAPSEHDDRVTLADIAPTIASMIGFDDFHPADGRALPGVPSFATPPKVVVTLVIDGGGWNVLEQWRDAWPNVERLMREGAVYRNAITGSSPAVTACAHATIGTGAFPRAHGITGHNIRDGGGVRKAYGSPGHADPSDILVPTLADRWVATMGGDAWVGEIGYQIWHLGMLGRGGRPLGDKPVAVYWDDDRTSSWQPQNADLYRLPNEVPPVSVLEQKRASYADPGIDDEYTERFLNPRTEVCCTPPIVEYQGDLIEATIRSERLGTHDATDLLFVNYKAPDYVGHVYNMLSPREEIALRAVDEQIGRLAEQLLDTYGPGNFAFIVTADHGQCPTVDAMGGVRVDPIQLKDDIEREFGRSPFELVQSVVPSEIYLDERAMLDLGITRDDIAAFLRDYRYGDNIGPYVKDDAIEHDRLNERPFAAVLSTDFLARLRGSDLRAYGEGRSWAAADPMGVPPRSW